MYIDENHEKYFFFVFVSIFFNQFGGFWVQIYQLIEMVLKIVCVIS